MASEGSGATKISASWRRHCNAGRPKPHEKRTRWWRRFAPASPLRGVPAGPAVTQRRHHPTTSNLPSIDTSLNHQPTTTAQEPSPLLTRFGTPPKTLHEVLETGRSETIALCKAMEGAVEASSCAFTAIRQHYRTTLGTPVLSAECPKDAGTIRRIVAEAVLAAAFEAYISGCRDSALHLPEVRKDNPGY